MRLSKIDLFPCCTLYNLEPLQNSVGVAKTFYWEGYRRCIGRHWKRRPGRPHARWTDQLRNDTGSVPVNLWRQTGHPTGPWWSDATARVGYAMTTTMTCRRRDRDAESVEVEGDGKGRPLAQPTRESGWGRSKLPSGSGTEPRPQIGCDALGVFLTFFSGTCSVAFTFTIRN